LCKAVLCSDWNFSYYSSYLAYFSEYLRDHTPNEAFERFIFSSSRHFELGDDVGLMMGVALIGFLCLMVLLAPAIWNGMEDVLAGEHILDLPAQVALLSLMLFPAMLAALIAFWKGKQDVEYDRRGFRSLEK